ncbi:MAG: class I SAM-dependent methyltransferase [Bacteroidales bacterium]|nr:class I SAM-dependent methyltransferase [Bacteroidales bacterium]
MKYDPIKRSLGEFFNQTPFFRKVFYRLLDILLLRTWHVKREIKSWKKNLQAEEPHLLDAGMGFGQYSYFLARQSKHWHVKGVDVKEEQIADCNAFFGRTGMKNVHFEYADLTRLQEKEDTYDLILSVDVMEHILEDEQVFRNFQRILKPGGMLLISTPSDKGGSDVHEHDEEGSSFIEEHVRDGYNIEDIQRKLKNAGFGKTAARYAYGKPGKISWRLSMKYPILMLNTGKVFYVLLPFYYLVTMPFSLILNYFDVRGNHKSGTGLIVKAWKES